VHVWFTHESQVWHMAAPLPHAAPVLPARQTPATSQQPVQF
jgi:hypothetical protein